MPALSLDCRADSGLSKPRIVAMVGLEYCLGKISQTNVEEKWTKQTQGSIQNTPKAELGFLGIDLFQTIFGLRLCSP